MWAKTSEASEAAIVEEVEQAAYANVLSCLESNEKFKDSRTCIRYNNLFGCLLSKIIFGYVFPVMSSA